MQTYNAQGEIIKGKQQGVRVYVGNLQANNDTLRSSFSGTSFPDNPVEGQHCYRTDKTLEYIYKSGGWVVNDDGTPTNIEVIKARGSLADVATRLSVALNDDGTLKNPNEAEIDEWKDNALVVTYVSATSFTVPKDLTSIFTASRKIKAILGTTSVITSVAASSYDSINTKTVVTVNDAVLTSELSAVKYSIVQYGVPSNCDEIALKAQIKTHDESTTAHPNIFYANAGAHNALYRGKDITDYWNSGGASAAIAAGTFSGIYPGDYIVKSVTVDGTTYSNVEWVVGDLDYHLHHGDTEDTTHHVLVFPRAHIGNKPMNATNITTGGFVGSVMWTTTLPLYATGIKAAFGADHVLSHRELLSNAESDTIASGAGAGWNGATTGWSWYDVTVNLFNEPMVYGGRVFSSSFFDVGDCNTQIAAMRHNKSLSFDRSYWCWLRAVASSSNFAIADYRGYANGSAASTSGGGVRPYFLLH